MNSKPTNQQPEGKEEWKSKFEHWLIHNLQFTSKSNVERIIDHVEKYIRPTASSATVIQPSGMQEMDGPFEYWVTKSWPENNNESAGCRGAARYAFEWVTDYLKKKSISQPTPPPQPLGIDEFGGFSWDQLRDLFKKVTTKENPGILDLERFLEGFKAGYAASPQSSIDVASVWNFACKQLLSDISDTFLNPENLNKADSPTDRHVFKGIGETIKNFPIPKLIQQEEAFHRLKNLAEDGIRKPTPQSSTSEEEKDLWLEVFKYNYKEGAIDTLATHVKEYLFSTYKISKR